MPRYDGCWDPWQQPLAHGLCPGARKGVAIAWGGVVLEQVTGEQDARIWHLDHDVIVGMPLAQVGEPQLAILDVDRRLFSEDLVRRRGHDLSELLRELWRLGDDLRAHQIALRDDPLCAARMAPDGGGQEPGVAEGVIP